MAIFGSPASLDPNGIGIVPFTPTTMPSGPAPDAYRKPGLFGSGGKGWKVLGLIGDTLRQRTGLPAIYTPMLEQQQQYAELERQRSLENDQELQRQEALYNYELKNPKPVNNDTINDVNWYMGATPEEKAAYDAMHPIYKVGPDGITYPVARSSLGAAPTAPVGKLTMIPETGGAGGNAGGNFPNIERYYSGQ